MKNAFLILLSALALVSCVQLESPQVENSDADFKVAFTIDCAGSFGETAGTKATIKSGWAVGDVVFVFFKDAVAPKYLEMKRSRTGWVSTPKNGLQIADLGDGGVMSAIYMPYGSDIEITGSNGNFYFSEVYNGLFYFMKQAFYTVEDKVLQGAIELSAPALSGNDKFIHFDITGYEDHSYMLYQDYVKPLTVSGINSFFDLKYYFGKSGDAIEGYVDNANGIVSFSGILDESAVGKSVGYEFSIDDRTDQVLYTLDAGERTLSEAKYIGIGDISKRWTATEYVVLTTFDGYDFCWAKKNLGATVESGEGSYGNYYAWGDVEGYPLEGTYGKYTCSHDFSTSPGGTPADDPAHYALKGLWRMPDYVEMHKLMDMIKSGDIKWRRKGTHASVSFGLALINKTTNATVFFPGTGVVVKDSPQSQGQYGEYWLSTSNNWCLYYDSIAIEYGGCSDGFARTIRPVFTVKSL